MKRTVAVFGLGMQVLPLSLGALVLTILSAAHWSGSNRIALRIPFLVGVGLAYVIYLLTRDREPHGVLALLALALLIGLVGGGWLPASTTKGLGAPLSQVGILVALGFLGGRWFDLGRRLPRRPLLAASWLYLAAWIPMALTSLMLQAVRAWALLGLALFTLLLMAWSSRLILGKELKLAATAGDLYLLALNMTIARLVLFVLR